MSRQTGKILSTKRARGQYIIHLETGGHVEVWRVWRSALNGRWYGESADRQGAMIDSPALRTAKYDLEHGFVAPCSSAGL